MGQNVRKKKLIELSENMLRSTTTTKIKQFYLEFLNDQQRQAWDAFKNSDILFLIGAAGTGKTHLAVAFALHEILEKAKDKILLSRPVVEAGENLGFLPGDIDEKIYPYMLPLYDCLEKMCGRDGEENREYINKRVELAPLAYLRGRAQPLDSIVYTTSGPKIMGEIQVGDMAIGSDGKPTRVLGVFPQGKKEVFKVYLSDGSSTECCDDHLWLTQTLSEKRHNKGFSVKDLRSVRENVKTRFNQKVHRLPILSAPIEFESKEPPVDPYLLGLLLGDGSLHNTASYSFCTTDHELVDSVSVRLPGRLKVTHSGGNDYRISGNYNRWDKNPLKDVIRELGLHNSKSYTKFIPDVYKFNSPTIRLEILRGLMDTDGWIELTKTNGCRIGYSTTSSQLAQDVRFIVESLGGIAYTRRRDYEDEGHIVDNNVIKHNHPSYTLDIVLPNCNPFRLTRKAEKYVSGMKPLRLISKIESCGFKECQCIQVDAPDHLYLTDHCIVTHNTFDDSICILDEAQNCTKSQLKLFLTRLGRNSKMIITGDPSQSDLGRTPDLLDVVSKLAGIESISTIMFNEESIVRHPLVSKIICKLS